jgi:hypothetical protein
MSRKPAKVQLDALQLKDLLEQRGEYKNVLKQLEETPNFNEKVLLLEGILKRHDVIPDFEKFKEKKSQKKSDSNREHGNKFYEKRNFLFSLGFYNKRFDLILFLDLCKKFEY